MKYTPEDLFQKCIGSLFVNESVEFFTKKVAMFLSMYMPISALFLVSSRGNTVTKLSEYNPVPALSLGDKLTVAPDLMLRMKTEKHFFSEGAFSIKVYTGHETCVFSELHNKIYGMETSAIYIPIRYNLLKDSTVLFALISIGKDCYTQGHHDVCSCIQPVLVDSFLNIVSESGDDQSTPRHERPAERIMDGDKPFQTFNEVTVNHIIKALTLTNGKISGQDGAAELLGLNPSTLWSKIRKHHINVKGLEQK